MLGPDFMSKFNTMVYTNLKEKIKPEGDMYLYTVGENK